MADKVVRGFLFDNECGEDCNPFGLSAICDRPARATSGYIALHQDDRLFRQGYLKRVRGYSDRMSRRFDFVGVHKTVRGTHVLVSGHQASRLGRAGSASKSSYTS
jgi:hypothetical protein